MSRMDDETAINIIHQLMQYDFSSHPFNLQLPQVDQGYGLTVQALEGLAKATGDPRIQSLAELALQAWRR